MTTPTTAPTSQDDLTREWVCADCAVISPYLDTPLDPSCECCGGILVDPGLVLAA